MSPRWSVTTGLLFLACALAWLTFGEVIWGGWPARFTVHLAPFIDVGRFRSDWSIRVDSLSAVMLVVVTTVSALVHLYSWGYMAHDKSKPRFFAYLSFFTFAMLALVTAADFMQLFFGWEGVGLASYLLIGFWFEKPTANAAAIKAFVVNRIGDFGFALGIMTVFWAFGTIRFAEIFPQVASHAGMTWSFAGQSWRLIDLACVLLFVGAMGKSAQFLLHTWLPDAMEGPTPVSALIHAATMVTAGVYMVCLLSPMFEYAPVARAGRHVRRRGHRPLRRHRRPGAERHQAGDRLLDLLAARLHVLRRRRRRLPGRRCSTCSPTPSSRRCCSWAPAR